MATRQERLNIALRECRQQGAEYFHQQTIQQLQDTLELLRFGQQRQSSESAKAEIRRFIETLQQILKAKQGLF